MIAESDTKSNSPAGENSTAATEGVALPADIAERVLKIQHGQTRHFVALVLARCLSTGQPVSVHSKIASRIVTSRRYSTYLQAMEQFRDVVSRDTTYMPKVFSETPKCMCWSRIDSHDHHESFVVVPLPGDFRNRVRAAFIWYSEVYLPSRFPESSGASSLETQPEALIDVQEEARR